MPEDEKDFIVMAVKLLFKRLNEGKVKLVAEKVPQTLEALKAVEFDKGGNPIFETITSPVRALANFVYTHEIEILEEEAEKREKSSPVHGLLSEPVAVNDEILDQCVQQASFSSLAFELYKEVGTVLAVCAHSYTSKDQSEEVLVRNQAICAGLLVRITKLMIAVAHLSSSGERGEVILALNRLILESSTNLRFLLLKNEERFYDQFVKMSLGPERELHDVIQNNIKARSGVHLPD